MTITRIFSKLSLFFLGLLSIYILLYIYINSSYNAYLISSIISNQLPGRFYIDDIKISFDFSKIEVNKTYIIAPKGEKVISIPKLDIDISPIKLLYSIIFKSRLDIDRVNIPEVKVNLIILPDEYINIAETFTNFKDSSKFYEMISEELYSNGTLFFKDDSFFSTSVHSKSSFNIDINDITIQKGDITLLLPDLQIKTKDFSYKNGSLQLNSYGVIIRGDGVIKDVSITQQNSFFELDEIYYTGFELSSFLISLKQGELRKSNTIIQFGGIWDWGILQKLDLYLKAQFLPKDFISFVPLEQRDLVDEFHFKEPIVIDASIYGTFFYPIAKANISFFEMLFRDSKIKKLNLNGIYKKNQSDLNIYVYSVNSFNEEIKRVKAELNFNNISLVKLNPLSLYHYDSQIVVSGDFDIKSGLGDVKIKGKDIEPSNFGKYLDENILKQYGSYLDGVAQFNLSIKGEDFLSQKNIESDINLQYDLKKGSSIGKTLKVSTLFLFNQMKIFIKRKLKISFGKNYLSLWGSIDIKKEIMNINTTISIFNVEKILALLKQKEVISGDLKISSKTSGYFFNPNIKMNLLFNNLTYLDYKESEISSDISLENGVFQLYGLQVANKDFSAFITTKAKLFEKTVKNLLKEPEFSLYLNLNQVNAGNILKNSDINGVFESEIEIYGTLSNIEGQLSLSSGKLNIFNENFDSMAMRVDLKKIESKNFEIVSSLAEISKFIVIKNGKDYLKLDGFFDLSNLDFALIFSAPRVSLKTISAIEKNGEPISGDVIVAGTIHGNAKEMLFDYKMLLRFESFFFPYTLTQTISKVTPSREYGMPDTIVFEEIPIRKNYNLGRGVVTIEGDQSNLIIDGDLFRQFVIKGKISDVIKKPLFSMLLFVKKFPVHRFYNFPIQNFVSLETFLEYDLFNTTLNEAKVVFSTLDIRLGDLKIREMERVYKEGDKSCVAIKDNKLVRENCIEFKNQKLILDFGLTFLSQNISISGTISNIVEEDFVKNAIFAINMNGGVDLKSFSYFKDNFVSIDGKAFLSSRFDGTLEQPKYSFNLRLSNASFQPVGFDKEVVIDDAILRLNQNKLYLSNLNGTLFGGNFEIKGDSKGLLYDFDTQNVSLSLIGYNLSYSIPDTVEFESNINLGLNGSLDELKLGGKVDIVGGKFYRTMNIVDQLLVDPLTSKSSVYQEEVNLNAIPIVKNISLDIEIINQGLIVSNDLMDDVDLKAEITLGGTLGKPIIEGRVTSNEGVVKLLTHRFDLTKFELNFNKGDMMLSILQFEAESQIKDYSPITSEYTDRVVRLIIEGPLNNLKILIEGDGLDKLQTMTLLLTGQSGADTNSPTGEDAANKITNQLIAVLLQNALGKMTSDFQKQMDIMIQTNIDTDGNLSLSANKMIGDRIMLKGTGEFENNAFQKEVSVQMTIIDQLVIEALKAFEKGTTNLQLKYRLLLK